MPRIGIQRAPSLDHFQYASWRQYSKYNEVRSMALGQANATPHQLSCGKTSTESPQSPVFGDCSASSTLVAIPRSNTLPYVLVSHERVHVALSIGTPVTSPYRAVEIWSDGNTCNTTAQPVTANLLASDEEHDHDRTNEIRSSKGVFECNDADMTDACGGHQDDAVPCAHHSQTCLFSCTGFLRPLPLADSFAVPDKFDQETPPGISSSLPLFSDLYRQKSIHPACRPLPQLRTPPYGIQTSHVRDSPRYFPLDIQGALGNGDTAFHMKNKNLPPIQTVVDGIETPGQQANVNDITEDLWNDQPCFKYLSYPSPLSSMDSATYQTPPTDRLASHQTDRLDCDFQVPQTTGPQDADWTPVDVMQKQWTLHDHSRLAARSWDKRNTPSLFTSSDIERASSIESQFDHEGAYEAESETTIFLGDFCATSPGSSSLVLTNARLLYSATSTTSTGAFACTPTESGTAGVSLSSSKSVLRRSTSGGAMQKPLPGARLVYMRPASSAPVSSDDSDSSGSDYEASVMCKRPDGKPNRPETGNTLAKFTTTKVRKQGNLKNEKSTGVENKKKRRRAIIVRWHFIDDMT
ncbi:hypothetical protein QFC21_003814 [Naganishia friedmannii]|uniref:Uncharacterized protein n=1 Tax=Naganishia friedmannii TaxID=89922 RepID=A0ACC2VKY4_9TREE|nr:hypothetical protein QFC21_003814 [Naganishia friedmannii]